MPGAISFSPVAPVRYRELNLRKSFLARKVFGPMIVSGYRRREPPYFQTEASTMKLNFRVVLAGAVISSLALVSTGLAQPVKGTAEIGITQPSTKVVGKEVVTTMKVKNLSKQSIAGFRVEEYWYDKAGNP
ncbi:MAG: hypothetical protein ABI565_13965, partial [Vicinamibacteria bacterium]